ncbi:UNVERIFIED_CONTAM: hypothetical protein K2H54_019222, partial [Gekko kuhli]
FVYLELPSAAKTPCTRVRWWQPVFSGEGYDQWAIDDIIILAEKMKQFIPVVNPTLPQNFYEKPAFDYPVNQLSVWLMLANEGLPKNETFCSATPSAMIFGKSDGDRFAVTRDLTLKPGYVLQFKGTLAWVLSPQGLVEAPDKWSHQVDEGLLLLPYLMTVYPEDEPPERAAYSHAHRHTRMFTEQAFGQLKMWFYCLHHAGECQTMQPLAVAELFALCALLHIIAICMSGPFVDVIGLAPPLSGS